MTTDDYHAGPDGSPLQAGAIPLRQEEGRLEILLVTSVANGNWGIPKGWPRRAEALRDAAVREALEEAGISGEIAKEPRAVYRYEKAPTANRPCGRDIAAYLMRVTEEKAVWPESRQRRRQWFGLEDAAARVKSRQLGAILSALARSREGSIFLDL